MSIHTIDPDITVVGEDSNKIDISKEEVSSTVSRLVNPRTVSQKCSPDARQKVSQDIRKYRGWRDEGRSDYTQTTDELINIQEEIRNLKGEQRTFKKSRWGKFLHMLDQYHIRTNQKSSDFNKAIESLELREEAYEEERRINQRRIDTYTKLPKETLSKFQEETLNTPLSVEEKKELLKPEVLSSLSLGEYMILWKRLHPYFLGHVTRQGFRDHVGGNAHIGGLEEFHEGFTSVLNDDKQLRPPISVHNGLNPHNRKTIETFVRKEVLSDSQDAQSAKSKLDSILWASLASAPKYAADTSVHFAKEIIADSTYGGESGNEIFYVFPSDVVASQYDYAFNWTEDFREKQHEEKWNDIFVWPSDRETNAIPLDMGIVFLPEDTQVDPNTGSKYAHEAGGEEIIMSENKENEIIVRGVLEILRKQGEEEGVETRFLVLMKERGFSLGEKLDFSTFDALNSYVNYTDKDNSERQDELVRKVLNYTNLLWQGAEDTVLSRVYWESYFKENPDKKPAHIVYYQGEPTQAVHDFLIENGIKEREDVSDVSDDPLLGLGEKHVSSMKEDNRANPGYEFLIEVAREIIDQHFVN